MAEFDSMHFAFLCAPARWLHSGWRVRVSAWAGMPDALCAEIWGTETFSQILFERFQLGFPPPVDASNPYARILFADAETLETGFLRTGLLCQRAAFCNTLDGARLRTWKEMLGEDNIAFVREADSQIDSSVPFLSRADSLRLGLSVFARALAPQDACMDARIVRRLLLKLPPDLGLGDSFDENSFSALAQQEVLDAQEGDMMRDVFKRSWSACPLFNQ